MKPVRNKKSKFNRIFPFFFAGVMTLSFSFPAPVFSESLQAPAFSEADLQGTLQSPAKYQGKILVLYFWATWCPWCRKDVKNMTEVFRTYHPKGVEFISISLDKDLSKLQLFVEEHRIPYPVLFDGKGWENHIAQLYGVNSTPSFILVNRKGEIQSAGGSSEDLKEKLSELV